MAFYFDDLSPGMAYYVFQLGIHIWTAYERVNETTFYIQFVTDETRFSGGIQMEQSIVCLWTMCFSKSIADCSLESIPLVIDSDFTKTFHLESPCYPDFYCYGCSRTAYVRTCFYEYRASPFRNLPSHAL